MDSFMSDRNFNVECPVTFFLSFEVAAALQVCDAVADVRESAALLAGGGFETRSIVLITDMYCSIYFNAQGDACSVCMFERVGHEFRDDPKQLYPLKFIRGLRGHVALKLKCHCPMTEQLPELISYGLFKIFVFWAVDNHVVHHGVLFFDAFVADVHELVQLFTTGRLSGPE